MNKHFQILIDAHQKLRKYYEKAEGSRQKAEGSQTALHNDILNYGWLGRTCVDQQSSMTTFDQLPHSRR